MLMADDARHLLRSVVLLRGLARQIGDRDYPAEPGFRAELPRRHDAVGPVESPGHDLDPRSIDAAEAERRAASRTEVTVSDGGRAERSRLAARPYEMIAIHVGEGRERGARCL